MVALSIDEAIEHIAQVSQKAAREKQDELGALVTFLVQFDVDSIIAWILLSTRLREFLGIRSTVAFVQARMDAGLIAYNTSVLLDVPLIVLGCPQPFDSFVETTRKPVFHFSRLPMKESVHPLYYQISRQKSNDPNIAILKYPTITTWALLCLLAASIPVGGAGNVIAISAASLWQDGTYNQAAYKEIMDHLSATPLISGDGFNDHLDVNKSHKEDNHFPGLFFYAMPLNESIKYSLVIQHSLHDIPPESRDSELKSIRVRLKLTVEEWTTRFQDLPHATQRSVLKEMNRMQQMAQVNIRHTHHTYPLIHFHKKKCGQSHVKANGDHRVSNLDLAFLLNQSLGGSQFAGRNPNERKRESDGNLALSRIGRMTAQASKIRATFDSWSLVIGIIPTSESKGWHDARREQVLANGISVYKKLSDRGTSIISLLKDRTRSLEREVSNVVEISPQMIVIYLTESAYLPLSICETRYLTVALQRSLFERIEWAPGLLMVQAGHHWSRMTLRKAGHRVVNDSKDPVTSFTKLALDWSYSKDLIAWQSFDTLIHADSVWNLFVKAFDQMVKNRNKRPPRATKRARASTTKTAVSAQQSPNISQSVNPT